MSALGAQSANLHSFQAGNPGIDLLVALAGPARRGRSRDGHQTRGCQAGTQAIASGPRRPHREMMDRVSLAACPEGGCKTRAQLLAEAAQRIPHNRISIFALQLSARFQLIWVRRGPLRLAVKFDLGRPNWAEFDKMCAEVGNFGPLTSTLGPMSAISGPISGSAGFHLIWRNSAKFGPICFGPSSAELGEKWTELGPHILARLDILWARLDQTRPHRGCARPNPSSVRPTWRPIQIHVCVCVCVQNWAAFGQRRATLANHGKASRGHISGIGTACERRQVGMHEFGTVVKKRTTPAASGHLAVDRP